MASVFQFYLSTIKKMDAELFQDNIPKLYFSLLPPRSRHNKMCFLLQIIISELLEASLL